MWRRLRIVSADGLAPPDLLGPADEVDAFLPVSGDAVEKEPEQPTRVRPVLMGRDVVAHPLRHLQLVERHQHHPPGQRQCPRQQLVVGHAFEDEPDVGRFACGDLVTGEQVPLRPFEAEAGDLDPRRLGHAPHTCRWVAEAGRFTRDDEVRVQDHVGAAGDAPALDGAIVGFEISCSLAKVLP